jgi:hypothetical protein
LLLMSTRNRACCEKPCIKSASSHVGHRNLRTRRRMHLCMQDNQIGLKFIGLSPSWHGQTIPFIKK